MKRSRRPLLGATAALLLVACASSPTDVDVPTRGAPTATTTPIPTLTATAVPSASPSALASPSSPPASSGHAHATAGESIQIEITNFAFVPARITVGAGARVTFTNIDGAPHTVTAGTDGEPMPELFDSGLLQQGESFTVVFDEPGTYTYYCERHPPMEGSVTVEP